MVAPKLSTGIISLFQEELDHTSLKSVVLNLFGSLISDILHLEYLHKGNTHKGSKITVMKEQESNFYVGGDHSMKNCPERLHTYYSVRKMENSCLRS